MRKESKVFEDEEDAPCFDEYLIAHYILNKSYSRPDELINDVASTFKLKREEAIVVLDGRSFNKILDKMLKVKEMILGITIINGLAAILETGSIKQKLKAIELLDYIYRINQRENRERRQLKLL